MNHSLQFPFALENLTTSTIAYKKWREHKLINTPNYLQTDLDKLFIDVENPGNPSQLEKTKILSACHQNSHCLYRIKNNNTDTKKNIHALAQHLGLSRLDNNLCADDDSLTSITQTSHQGQHEYIPYSTKRLSWHTDGYYNTPEKNINAMQLHCANPAKEGGMNLLMDHEIAYLLLRDKNPEYIKALMQPDAMTIPANILNGKIIREAQTGPVFSVNDHGQLHMRYSARKRNIEWKQTSPTLEAVEFLDNLLASNSKYIIKYTLKAGEGLICRNILHRRTSFVDYDERSKKRLLYRGRYFDSILPI